MSKNKTKKGYIVRTNIEDLIVLLVGVAMLIVGLVLRDSEPVIGTILIIIGAYIILISPYVYLSDRARIRRSFCKSCGAKYDYASDIAWTVTEKTKAANKETAMVEFECTCPACKDVRTFSKKFTTASYNKEKNSWKIINISDSARKRLFVKK